MKQRNDTRYVAIVARDANDVHAPAIYVEVDRRDPKYHRKAIEEAKKRSGLSRFNGWTFH